MTAYPDTSFLCALYRGQTNTAEAYRHFLGMTEPLHVTPLLAFEFRNSTRWQGFLHAKDRNKGFNQAAGVAMLNKFQGNIASGAIVVASADWLDVYNIAERLSDRHVLSGGHRGFDLLHVATALHFAVRDFLTFDMNQKKLAKAEGLKVPL
jgi:predicted nucleic acid-binding protein